jgi:hypothetical protein
LVIRISKRISKRLSVGNAHYIQLHSHYLLDLALDHAFERTVTRTVFWA